MLAAAMKTPLIYGLYLALAGLLLNLGLFFAGYHSDPDKMMSVQWPSLVIFVAIAAILIVLGIKARRAEIPASDDFGYGRALWAGVLIGAFSCVIGIVTNLLYTRVINPRFKEVMIQGQINKMEAAGLPSDQVEKMEKMMHSPVAAVVNTIAIICIIMVIYTIISLIAAAFLKRPAAGSMPPVTA